MLQLKQDFQEGLLFLAVSLQLFDLVQLLKLYLLMFSSLSRSSSPSPSLQRFENFDQSLDLSPKYSTITNSTRCLLSLTFPSNRNHSFHGKNYKNKEKYLGRFTSKKSKTDVQKCFSKSNSSSWTLKKINFNAEIFHPSGELYKKDRWSFSFLASLKRDVFLFPAHAPPFLQAYLLKGTEASTQAMQAIAPKLKRFEKSLITASEIDNPFRFCSRWWF